MVCPSSDVSHSWKCCQCPEFLKSSWFDLRNPNKLYSLIGGFCGAPVNFHAKDGSGYKFLGEAVLQLDKINLQVAFCMVSAFSRWRRYDEGRQMFAKPQLDTENGLSENVYEIASKSLAA